MNAEMARKISDKANLEQSTDCLRELLLLIDNEAQTGGGSLRIPSKLCNEFAILELKKLGYKIESRKDIYSFGGRGVCTTVSW